MAADYKDTPLMEVDPGMQFLENSFGGGKNEGSRQMAAVAAQGAAIATDQWNTYKEVFGPYEQDLVDAHRKIIPEQTGLDLARIKSQEADVTGRMPVNEEIRQQQMRSLQRSEPVEQAFYDEAMQGINLDDRMNAAGTDVQQAYDSIKPQMQRDMSRMGTRQDSGKFTDAMAKMSYNRARDTAFARTNARRLGQKENLGRLGTAMAARGNIAGLTAQTGGAATNPLGQGMAGIGLQKAGQSLSGLQGAGQGFSQVAQAEAGQQQSAVSGVGALVGAFSDERLKTNVVRIGSKHNMPWYTWKWNALARELFGLAGVEEGHMAGEVELKHPELVSLVHGYKTVNYGGLV